MSKSKPKRKRKINSRVKGAVGERELATYLTERGHITRRGQQFAGGGDSPDVKSTIPGVHFEVKRVESLLLYPAMDQAIRDAKPGNMPVVVHRRNHKPWVVVMGLDDFLRLVHDPMADLIRDI